jgi:aminocarboxymuconate-semialdehyde decarboxylase
MVKELHVPVLLHPPAEPVGSDSVRDFRLVEQIQRYSDVLVGLAVLIFSGRLERDPDLTIIAATSGGGISLVSGRLDTAHAPRHWGPKPGSGPPPDAGAPAPPAMQQQENRISRPPSEYLRRVYVDTTNGSVHGNLANLEVMGADRIMFGTDSPPLSTPLRDAVARIDDLPIPDEDKQKIFSGNAKALFKLDV